MSAFVHLGFLLVLLVSIYQHVMAIKTGSMWNYESRYDMPPIITYYVFYIVWLIIWVTAFKLVLH